MTDVTEAIAVLMSVDLEKGSPNWDFFRESDGVENPLQAAMDLRESCKGDFPDTRFWMVTGNDRARELRADAIMKALFG